MAEEKKIRPRTPIYLFFRFIFGRKKRLVHRLRAPVSNSLISICRQTVQLDVQNAVFVQLAAQIIFAFPPQKIPNNRGGFVQLAVHFPHFVHLDVQNHLPQVTFCHTLHECK